MLARPWRAVGWDGPDFADGEEHHQVGEVETRTDCMEGADPTWGVNPDDWLYSQMLFVPASAASWKLCNQVESHTELLEWKIFNENKPVGWHSEKQAGGKNKSDKIKNNHGSAGIFRSEAEVANGLGKVQYKPKDGDYHPWQEELWFSLKV